MDLTSYRYLGNYSAVDPAYSRGMSCDDCRVSWTGCWDNFQCPICGRGELPSCEVIQLPVIQKRITQPENKDLRRDDPSLDRLTQNLETLKALHVELRGILDELERMVT